MIINNHQASVCCSKYAVVSFYQLPAFFVETINFFVDIVDRFEPVNRLIANCTGVDGFDAADCRGTTTSGAVGDTLSLLVSLQFFSEYFCEYIFTGSLGFL